MESAIDIRVNLEDDEPEHIRRVVLTGLRTYNRERAVPPDYQPLVVAARHDTQIIGGLIGETAWKWLCIELLWISEAYRGKGIGRLLLQTAEQEARRRRARHAYVDTFDFQARPFYEKQGYTVFGTLEDYPPGHTRFYLRKDLTVLEKQS